MGTFIKSSFTSADADAPRITALYAADTFTRGSGAPGSTELGSYTWNHRAGTFSIAGGRLSSGDTTAATPADCWIDPLKLTGSVSAQIHATGTGNHAGIIFRRAAVGNTGWVYYARDATHTLAKRTGSDSFTVVPATGPVPGFTPGEEIRVDMLAGGRIVCSVNGAVTHDITDALYSEQTGVGLETRMATAAAPAIFDSFVLSAV